MPLGRITVLPIPIEFGFWGGLVCALLSDHNLLLCPRAKASVVGATGQARSQSRDHWHLCLHWLSVPDLPTQLHRGISPNNVYLLVAAVVLLAVSSTNPDVLKVLSLVSLTFLC